MSVTTRELHIEVKQPPPPGTKQVVIMDETGLVIYKGKATLGNEEWLRNVLQGLSKKGVQPETVFIDPFSNIIDDVKSIWPEVRVLFEYW